MTWNQLQSEVNTWATKNFGDTLPWMPFMGLIEEIGEFFASEYQSSRTLVIDALGDQTVYALNLCEKVGLKFGVDIADQNVPAHFTERELLGVLAAGCRAILKNAQAIRGFSWDKRREHMRVCVSLWYRWATHQCTIKQLPPLLDITHAVWGEVKLRDWQKNPDNAHEIASQETSGVG